VADHQVKFRTAFENNHPNDTFQFLTRPVFKSRFQISFDYSIELSICITTAVWFRSYTMNFLGESKIGIYQILKLIIYSKLIWSWLCKTGRAKNWKVPFLNTKWDKLRGTEGVLKLHCLTMA